MKKNALAILILSIVTALILLFLFKPVLQHPNSILYSKSGDALKSYFNFSYYLKYDDGIKHDGINYPYGDHLQYINSHPLYVQILKFVDNHVYPIQNYGVAILNLSMILSMLFAVPFLFLILRRFLLPRWYAAIIAVIILFLTPQFDRIHGHFEMVYAFFLPMFWYLLIRYREGKQQLLWGSLLVLSGLIGGFTSAYYATFYGIFLLGVLIVDFWNHRKHLKAFVKPAISLFVIAVLPILVVKGLVSITDWVSDRPDNPYGFYVYHANVFSIFQPFHSPLKAIIGNYIDMDFQWEGRSYVGLPATLLAVSIVIWYGVKLIKRQKLDSKVFFLDSMMNTYLVASTLILLFSMCFPFKWGFGFLLELLPPVKQFRALGRFSWIFYYVFTVYTAWFIYSLFLKLKAKSYPVIAVLLMVFILFYWSVDAGTNIKRSTRSLFNHNDKLEADDSEFLNRFREAKVNPDEFQAIFFLPFANTCGDKLLFEKGMNAFSEAMKCSYHTGIPLVQSFSPRLSFTHALSSIQMLADSCIYKTRIDDMNDKPILLVTTKEHLNNQEQWLKDKSTTFWEDKYISLSKLPIYVFGDSYQNWEQIAKETVTELNNISENIFSDTLTSEVYYNDFDDQISENVFSGEGASFKRRGEIELLNQKMPLVYCKGVNELSLWLFVDTRMYDMPQLIIEAYDEDSKQVDRIKLNNREVHNVYNHWVRIEGDVSFKANLRYRFIAKGKYITVDDFMIKPVNSNVFIKKEGVFDLFNNFPLKK